MATASSRSAPRTAGLVPADSWRGRLWAALRVLFASAPAPVQDVPEAPVVRVQDPVLEALIDGVLHLDPDGRVTAANPAACAMFGMAGEAMVGVRCVELFHGLDPDQPRLEVRRTAQGAPLGEVMEGEGRTAAGRAFPAEIQRVGADPSRPDALVVRDVSESERRIRRLTRANARLSTALEGGRAERRSRAELLARMAAASVGPVATAMEGAQSALRHAHGRSPELVEDLEQVLDGAVHAQRLMDAVVELLQLDAGSLPTASDAVDVEAVAQRVVRRLQPMAGVRRVGLRVELPEGLPPGGGTADRVEQVLSVLLEDLLLRAEAAQIRLTAETVGERVQIEMHASPVTVPDAVARAMHCLGSSWGSHGDDVRVLGFELVRCRALAQWMGAVLGASLVGTRLTYQLTLPIPRAEEALEAPTDAAPPMLLEDWGATDAGSRKLTPMAVERVEEGSPLFVVWPEPEGARLLEEALRSRGWLVRVEPWARGLVAKVAEAQPAVVVLPGGAVDDLDLQELLAEDPGSARVPRVVVSPAEVQAAQWDEIHRRVGAEVLLAAMRGLGA